MASVRTNGVDIEVDVRGEGPLVLLVMGLGAQMCWWPDEFVERFAAEGFRVARLDNRDTGLSSRFEFQPRSVLGLVGRRLLGRPVPAPYRLHDMADDLIGILDAWNAPAAHLVGVSMGGMIAQLAAIRHPHRVKSLTGMMTTPGTLRSMISHPRGARTLFAGPASDPEASVARSERIFSAITGRGQPSDMEAIRALARRCLERSFEPDAPRKHLAAVLASGPWRQDLTQLKMPALLLHGSDDPLVLPSAGRAVAASIPGAEFELIDGMGHDLPRQLWPLIIERISCHVRRSEGTLDFTMPFAQDAACSAEGKNGEKNWNLS